MTRPTSRATIGLKLAVVVACALSAGACTEVGKNLPPPKDVMALQQGPIQRTEYRLMAGDKLQIKFPYHHARDQELPIRPDGKISLDVTGEIQAEGLTPLELAGVIKERSAKYLRNPEVVVVVAGIGDRRVYVGGEVNRPGFVVIQEGMTPLQAVMAVGGFKDSAQKSDVLYIARGADLILSDLDRPGVGDVGPIGMNNALIKNHGEGPINGILSIAVHPVYGDIYMEVSDSSGAQPNSHIISMSDIDQTCRHVIDVRKDRHIDDAHFPPAVPSSFNNQGRIAITPQFNLVRIVPTIDGTPTFTTYVVTHP